MKRILLLLLSALSLWGCGCVRSKPPTVEGPAPAPHEGLFVAGENSLSFNGDGKSVSWHFAEPIPPLPAEGSGTYVFLFHHEMYRYDAAEKFCLFYGEDGVTFLLAVRPATAEGFTLSGGPLSGSLAFVRQ